MLERSTNAAAYLRLLRDPDVQQRAMLGHEVVDAPIMEAVADPRNVLLMAEHGAFFFIHQSPEIYEVHTAFTREGRGYGAVTRAKQAAAYMFQRTEALAIRTFVAHDNRAARRLALGVGFVPLRDAATLGTPGVEYLLTIKQWAKELKCQPQQLGQSQA